MLQKIAPFQHSYLLHTKTFFTLFLGYHEYHQFIPWREEWIKLTTNPMDYQGAVSYCADRRLEMFHPRDSVDNEIMVTTMTDGGLSYMWYPINDIDIEGNYKWENGSGRLSRLINC